jgi:hypothetical protein
MPFNSGMPSHICEVFFICSIFVTHSMLHARSQAVGYAGGSLISWSVKCFLNEICSTCFFDKF